MNAIFGASDTPSVSQRSKDVKYMDNYPPGLSQEKMEQLGIEEKEDRDLEESSEYYRGRIALQIENDIEDWENLSLAQKFEHSLKGHLTTRERYDKN